MEHYFANQFRFLPKPEIPCSEVNFGPLNTLITFSVDACIFLQNQLTRLIIFTVLVWNISLKIKMPPPPPKKNARIVSYFHIK